MDSLKLARKPTGACLIEAQSVTRHYGQGTARVAALRGVDFRVAAGEKVAIMGPSGCGKSTLLGLLAGLDAPTSGRVVLAGKELACCSRSERAELRRAHVGFLPQSPTLLPMLTVEENVDLPLALQHGDRTSRRRRVHELLDLLEIADKAAALPEELSGGQQQRVAIARALATTPAVLLVDEPVGSLDTRTARAALSVLTEEADRAGCALVLVTHEEDEADYADRIVRMRDGLVIAVESKH